MASSKPEYCPIAACMPERLPEPFPPEMLEGEVWGKLHSVEEFCRGLILARIEEWQVIVPDYLEEKLQRMIGHPVIVAKIEGKFYAAERKPARLKL